MEITRDGPACGYHAIVYDDCGRPDINYPPVEFEHPEQAEHHAERWLARRGRRAVVLI